MPALRSLAKRPRQTKSRRRYEDRYSRHWKRLAALVPVAAAMMLTPSAEQPYYSSIAFGVFFTPLSVVYAALSHAWVFGIQRRRNVAIPLPEPTEANRGKLAVVTGSNTGIGFETARTLVVGYGWEVLLACRSKDKALHAMDSINSDPARLDDRGRAVVLDVPLDLTDFDSIKAFVENVNERYPERKVDVLINNAGRNTSGESGKFDLLFRANFLGHFVLTQQLLDKLRGGRIINLSSVMHHFAGTSSKDDRYWKRMILKQRPQQPETYSASKLASVLFTKELNRRYSASHGITSLSTNPGACSSDIWRGFPGWVRRVTDYIYLTPRQGSAPSVAAAVKDDWGSATYLQPLWLPNTDGPAFPLCEMLGPYIGYAATSPRLPTPELTEKAGRSMWKTCEELSGFRFP